jgi:hypothetical protein
VGEPPAASGRDLRGRAVFTHQDSKRLRELAEAAARGELKIPIGKRFPLAQVREAHRLAERGGDIDVGIAILDGIGLLFFIIPGVIAYAVDFSNGTIYLPNRSRRASGEADELRRIHFDPHRSTCADIEAILERETGRTIKLDEPTVQVFELGSVDEMKARFAGDQPY